MNDEKRVDAYIRKHGEWADLLNNIRQILSNTVLIETVKW